MQAAPLKRSKAVDDLSNLAGKFLGMSFGDDVPLDEQEGIALDAGLTSEEVQAARSPNELVGSFRTVCTPIGRGASARTSDPASGGAGAFSALSDESDEDATARPSTSIKKMLASEYLPVSHALSTVVAVHNMRAENRLTGKKRARNETRTDRRFLGSHVIWPHKDRCDEEKVRSRHKELCDKAQQVSFKPRSNSI
ncbi:MAG: hypothetical protein K0R66_1411 [Gammaproteobacteria bacterium]|nr:hypothetical protein [Gammaproteobacteria bacterium]